MHHHGPPQPKPGQGIGHGIEQVRPGHTEHLGLRPQRIHKRPQQVEHRAHPQAAAQGRQAHQGGMPARSEQKSDAGAGESGHHLLLGGLQLQTQPLQHIRRAHPAAGAAVAVLGNMGTAGGGQEGHGGGDVETVGAIAARAAGVYQGELRAAGGLGAGLAQHPGHRRQLLTIDALGAQGRQHGTGEHRWNLLVQPALHQAGGQLAAEGLAGQQALQQGGPAGGLGISNGHRHASENHG